MNKLIILSFLMFSSCLKSKEAWHLGLDSNNNGVRDDIEQWIETKFQKENRVKKAMMKLASVDPATCDYKFHSYCLNQVSQDGLVLQLELFAKTLDTDKRREAFKKRLVNCPQKDDRYTSSKCTF